MARCTLTEWQSTGEKTVVEGYHDGYSRCRNPVIHRRRLEFRKPDELRITDMLDGRHKHSIQVLFHFMPSTIHRLAENSYVVKFDDGLAMKVEFEGAKQFAVSLSEQWISLEWKRKFITPCITVSSTSTLPFELVTVIRIVANGGLDDIVHGFTYFESDIISTDTNCLS